MFKTLILLLVFQVNVLLAQTLEECVDIAKDYGVVSAPEKIPQSCSQKILENSHSLTQDKSTDEMLHIAGSENLLFVKKFTLNDLGQIVLDHQGVTTGKHSLLNKIKAVELDEINNMAFILNEDENARLNVLALPVNKTGSLATQVKLFSDEIQGAHNIKTDRSNNELYVTGDHWIKVFNIDAHAHSSRPEQSIAVKRVLAGNQTELIQIQDLAIKGEEIFVLDSDRILVFSRLAQEDSLPQRTIEGLSTQIEQANEIDISNNKIVVTNINGEKIFFDLNDSGDVSPLN